MRTGDHEIGTVSSAAIDIDPRSFANGDIAATPGARRSIAA